MYIQFSSSSQLVNTISKVISIVLKRNRINVKMMIENIIYPMYFFVCRYKELNHRVSLDNIHVYCFMLRAYMMMFDGFIHFDDEVMKQNTI
jgi:hypothetical protein